MRVGADDGVAGNHKALFRKKRVLDAHFADIEEVFNAVFFRKGTYLFAVFGGFNIFVRGEVVHHERNAVFVKDFIKTFVLHFVNRHGRGYVVAHDEVQIDLNQLPCRHTVKACVRGKNFLCHCHAH